MSGNPHNPPLSAVSADLCSTAMGIKCKDGVVLVSGQQHQQSDHADVGVPSMAAH
jgi:hypothetical protein